MAMSPTTGRVLKLGALAVLLVGTWLLWRWSAVQRLATQTPLATVRDRLGAPRWSPLAFVVVYAALTVLNFSGLALPLGGGVVFGFERGVVLNTIGANLGANAAYMLARILGRDAVPGLLGARFSRMQRFAGVGCFRWLLS